MRRGSGFLPVLVVALAVALAGCTPDKAPQNTEPLPTQAIGDACGFVSQDSAEIALGETGLSPAGLKQDLAGTARNADGSKLNLAGCKFYAAGDKELDVSVKQIGIPPYEERAIPTALKDGGADFVFPASEGQGFAKKGEQGQPAATAQLIRGDWYYLVFLTKQTDGRNAVDDVVAVLRQVVDQLGLPRSENLPRPSASPTS
ncbi:hypothetical protein GCM10009744_45410 [Kribbella alba]|uniref:DUF3558 domain-containing protein n=1 Tax=Kribbella alba TaxID=190197 RepID=A0ABN2FK77_9ACTN